jgi:hypothetical protein
MLFRRRVGKGTILPTVVVKPHFSVGNATAFAHPTKKSRCSTSRYFIQELSDSDRSAVDVVPQTNGENEVSV